MAQRSDIDRAIANLMHYARREPWGERHATYIGARLAATLERFGLTDQQLAARMDELGLGGMLIGFLSEASFTEEYGGPDTSLLAEYLKRRGWQEPPRARRYLEAMRDSLPSLYEIVDVEAGAWVDVRDVVRNTPIQRVHEESGSRQLVRWDRIAARVLEVNGERMFAGGILHYPGDAADSIQGILERSLASAKKKLATLTGSAGGTEASSMHADDLLRVSARVFVDVWLIKLLERLTAPPPELHNTDEHRLLFTRARLPVEGAGQTEIARRMDALPAWERDAPDSQIWHKRAAPRPASKRKPSRKAGRPKARASGARTTSNDATEIAAPGDKAHRIIVATVELRDSTFIVETNSRERMTAALQELQPALEGLVRAPLISHEDAQAALKPPRTSKPALHELPPAVAASEEIAGVLHHFKLEHFRRTLDEEVSMLGNRTPRQCAGNPKHHSLLVRWLKEIENSELRQARSSGQPALDVHWMWQELGVEDLR